MQLRVLASELQTISLRTRIPFRYGIATMTDVPLAFLRVWLEAGGREVQGVASDCLPPKWFTKVPDKSLGEEVREMRDVIGHAQEVANGLAGPNVFDLWRQIYDAQIAWARAHALPPLLANFGTSLVERALIDAACRATGETFFDLLKSGALGIVLSEVHQELKGVGIAELLPAQPLSRVIVRHTIGLADPLAESEIPEPERLHDGLPQSLEAAVQRYRLKHFKIKVSGRLAGDRERLSMIAQVLESTAARDYRFSLDGNEQFDSLATFRDFWRETTSDPALREFFARLLFVEQPLNRSVALGANVAKDFANWADRPPIIIDESDGDLRAVPTALDLGYAGSSHKNCKGVLKGIANFALIATRHARTGRHAFMTGEDLCNVGPVALQQDLAVMAALGISSVERNGHHYHAGLSQFPSPVQNIALAGHPDHYEASPAGWPTLRIARGEVAMGSINAAPFGSVFRGEDCFLLKP